MDCVVYRQYTQVMGLPLTLSACYDTLVNHRLCVIECVVLLYRHDTLFQLYITPELVNFDSLLEQLNDQVINVSLLLIEYASLYSGDLVKGKRLLEWMAGRDCDGGYLLVALGLFIPMEFDIDFQKAYIEPLLEVVKREWKDKKVQSIVAFYLLVYCRGLANANNLDISLVTGLTGQEFDARTEAVLLSEEHNPIRILGDRLEVLPSLLIHRMNGNTSTLISYHPSNPSPLVSSHPS